VPPKNGIWLTDLEIQMAALRNKVKGMQDERVPSPVPAPSPAAMVPNLPTPPEKGIKNKAPHPTGTPPRAPNFEWNNDIGDGIIKQDNNEIKNRRISNENGMPEKMRGVYGIHSPLNQPINKKAQIPSGAVRKVPQSHMPPTTPTPPGIRRSSLSDVKLKAKTPVQGKQLRDDKPPRGIQAGPLNEKKAILISKKTPEMIYKERKELREKQRNDFQSFVKKQRNAKLNKAVADNLMGLVAGLPEIVLDCSSDSDVEKEEEKEGEKDKVKESLIEIKGENKIVEVLADKDHQDNGKDGNKELCETVDDKGNEEGISPAELEVIVINNSTSSDSDKQLGGEKEESLLGEGGEKEESPALDIAIEKEEIVDLNSNDNHDQDSIRDYYAENDNSDFNENDHDVDHDKYSDSPVTTLSDISNSPCPSKIKANIGFKSIPDIDDYVPIVISTETAAIIGDDKDSVHARVASTIEGVASDDKTVSPVASERVASYPIEDKIPNNSSRRNSFTAHSDKKEQSLLENKISVKDKVNFLKNSLHIDTTSSNKGRGKEKPAQEERVRWGGMSRANAGILKRFHDLER
jgi:hypothetical protein